MSILSFGLAACLVLVLKYASANLIHVMLAGGVVAVLALSMWADAREWRRRP